MALFPRLQHSNTSICIRPHAGAIALDSRIPLVKVGLGDAVLVADGLAGLARRDVVEGLARGGHAALVRRRRRDAVARRGCVSDDGGADVIVDPERSTIGLHGRIPRRDLLLRDALGRGDGGARVSRLDLVEAVTVVDHVGLDGCRSGDAIAGSGGGSRGFGRSVADDRYTGVCVSPESGAGRADVGIPGLELSHSDTVLGCD